MGTRLLLAATLLLLRTPGTEALGDLQLCFILDAILFLYGLILTVLYCRLKFLTRGGAQQKASKEKEEAVYTELSGKSPEFYETLQMKDLPPTRSPTAGAPPVSPSGTVTKN